MRAASFSQFEGLGGLGHGLARWSSSFRSGALLYTETRGAGPLLLFVVGSALWLTAAGLRGSLGGALLSERLLC
jgi:hypothetical protein